MGLAELQSEVERRMARGEGFNAVEDWLNELDLPQLVKSGLWLLAFSLVERRAQRQLVVGYLGHLEPEPALV